MTYHMNLHVGLKLSLAFELQKKALRFQWNGELEKADECLVQADEIYKEVNRSNHA